MRKKIHGFKETVWLKMKCKTFPPVSKCSRLAEMFRVRCLFCTEATSVMYLTSSLKLEERFLNVTW